MSKEIVGAKEAADKLNKYFPEVAWDRFVREDEPIDQELREASAIYSMYGWIEREDSYKDFIFVTFYWDGYFTYWTSSAKYSEIFHERIQGSTEGHTDCERIEEWFPDIKNVVRLKK